MSVSDPQRKPLLPRSVVKWLAIAFGVGLVLFLMLWLDQRNDTDFFKGGPTGQAGAEPSLLPAPLPPDLAGRDDNASGLRLPDGDAPSAPPPPVAEQPRIIDEPAPTVAPPVAAPPFAAGPDRAPVPVSRPAPFLQSPDSQPAWTGDWRSSRPKRIAPIRCTLPPQCPDC